MMLPNGWKRVKLGDVAKVTSGGTPLRTKSEYWNGNIPWVKTAQIQNGHISLDQVEEYITEKGVAESSAKIVPKGTLLMAMYGQGKTRGQVAMLDFDASINQACAAFHLNKSSIIADYLYQFFLFDYENIRNMSNSGGQKNLSAEIIKNIPIALPPLSEQNKIAETLSVWDKAIEKTEKLIKAKESILSEYGRNLFGKINQNARDNWDAVTLSSVLNEHGDKSTGEEEVYSVSVHKGLVNQIEHLGRSFAAKNTANYNRVHYGDIVYTKSPTGDFPLGIVKQSLVEDDVIVSPLYGVFTPKTFELGAILDFYFSSAINANNYLHPIAQKGAKNTINITNKKFLSAKLCLPLNLKEQRKVAEFIQVTKKEMSVLQEILENYKKQKQGLMQKLLTGQWRVK
jgi:type I restriction enzyme S subunit